MSRVRFEDELEPVLIPEKMGRKVYCRYCNYEWVYCGKREFYASCPRCRTAIKLKEKVKKELAIGGEP
jgi:hypothetical protein